MNPNLLPSEMSISDQARILRELQELPHRLFELKEKLNEHNRNIVGYKNTLLEKEFSLEATKAALVLTAEFAELKNDTARKAHITQHTQVEEGAIVLFRQYLTVEEANLAEFKSEHDSTYLKLRALMIASEQIAAYMNFAAAGEQP